MTNATLVVNNLEMLCQIADPLGQNSCRFDRILN